MMETRWSLVPWGGCLLVFTTFLLISWIPTGQAIHCYACSSRNWSDYNCHDPYNSAYSTYIRDCMVAKKVHIGQFPGKFCIKIKGVTMDTDEELVIRACSIQNMENQCGIFRFEGETLRGCILTCDNNGCNPAKRNRPTVSVFAFALITAVVSITRKFSM